MTTYNTGNGIGSADPRDLYDNAQVIDDYANGDADTTQDRLGVTRKTLAGMENEFDQDQADREQRWNLLLANSGYDYLADYAAGIEVTEYNQVIRDGAGKLWRAAATTTLPYTTDGTGLPEGGAFIAIGDADIRNDLAAGVGAGKGGLLVRGAVIYVDTIADLQALDTSALVDGQQTSVSTTGRAGSFVWVAGDQSANVTDDPSGGIWVAPAGDTIGTSGAWKRIHSLPGVHVNWFGAVAQDAGVDSAPAIQAANDWLEKVGRPGGVLLFGKGAYRCASSLRVGGYVTWRGAGSFSTSLYWDSGVTGNLIVLGPDQSGEFAFSGQYTFGSIIEDMDVNFGNVYRNVDAAAIYTEGAHQNSGLRRMNIRGVVSYAVNYADSQGAPASFFIEDVSIQGSQTAPTLGNKIAIRSNSGGSIFSVSRVQIETDNTSPFVAGIQMISGFLSAKNVHFEGCEKGVVLSQNEPTTRNNTLSDITGRSDVPNLIEVGTNVDLVYQINNANNTTADNNITINVLRDLKSGYTKGGPGGAVLANYTNVPRVGGGNVAHAVCNYLVGTGFDGNYGFSSVTINGTGDYTFNLTESMGGTSVAPFATPRFSAGAAGFAVATALSSTSIQVQTYNAAGAAAAPQRIYLSVFTPNR